MAEAGNGLRNVIGLLLKLVGVEQERRRTLNLSSDFTVADNEGQDYLDVGLGGAGVVPTITDGDDVLVTNAGGTATEWANGLTNAHVATGAAIAGTKVSPDFGSQAVTTSGNVTITGSGDLKIGSSPGAGLAINLTQGDAIGFGSRQALSMDTGENIFLGTGSSDAIYLECSAAEKIYSRVNGSNVLEVGAALVKSRQPVAIGSQNHLPSGTCDLALPDEFTVLSREDDDSADVEIMSLDASEVLMVGGTTTGPSSIRFGAGAGERFAVYDTKLQSGVASFEWHRTNAADPSIYQATDIATDGQGDTFTAHAQDVSGAFSAVNPRGGDKVVRSGGDDSATATDVDSGNVEVYCGAVKNSGTRGSIYLGIDSGNTAANRADNVVVDSTDGLTVRRNGSTRAVVSNSLLSLYAVDIAFTPTTVAPEIIQSTDSTTDAQGDTFTTHAQDVSGAFSAVNPRGGDKVIRSGGDDSATATNVDSGNVEIYPGAVKGSGARGTVYVGTDSGATAENRANAIVCDVTTSYTFNRLGSAKLTVASSNLRYYGITIGWEGTVTAPELAQDDETTASAVGETFTDHAQDCTGTTSTGGDRITRPGKGTSAGGSWKCQSGEASPVTRIEIDDTGIGFFAATPVAQPSSTGETTGHTAGSTGQVYSDSTFTGNVGTKAYTINDIVKHLKNLGAVAAS